MIFVSSSSRPIVQLSFFVNSLLFLGGGGSVADPDPEDLKLNSFLPGNGFINSELRIPGSGQIRRQLASWIRVRIRKSKLRLRGAGSGAERSPYGYTTWETRVRKERWLTALQELFPNVAHRVD
jgi:hypothetical protein